MLKPEPGSFQIEDIKYQIGNCETRGARLQS